MRKMIIPALLLLLLAAALSAAEDIDYYFSVKETDGDYSAVPGDEVVVGFTLRNIGHTHPRNVTAYFDPCPLGWECEEKTFSFEHEGDHHSNLTMGIPENALTKRFTMYIRLESEYTTKRGYDKVMITVMPEDMAEAMTYEEYLERQEGPVPVPEQVSEEVLEPEPEQAVPEQGPEPEPAEEMPEPELYAEPEPEPEKEKTEMLEDVVDVVVEDVERLESSRQFVEYASIILGALLVFVALGAFVSYKKKE